MSEHQTVGRGVVEQQVEPSVDRVGQQRRSWKSLVQLYYGVSLVVHMSDAMLPQLLSTDVDEFASIMWKFPCIFQINRHAAHYT